MYNEIFILTETRTCIPGLLPNKTLLWTKTETTTLSSLDTDVVWN